MDLLLKKSDHVIIKLQERVFEIIYNDFNSRFSETLEISNESTTHIRNIKALMTEISKCLNNLSFQIMNNIFKSKKIITL